MGLTCLISYEHMGRILDSKPRRRAWALLTVPGRLRQSGPCLRERPIPSVVPGIKLRQVYSVAGLALGREQRKARTSCDTSQVPQPGGHMHQCHFHVQSRPVGQPKVAALNGRSRAALAGRFPCRWRWTRRISVTPAHTVSQ